MPTYRYQAVDEQGRTQKGRLEASNEEQAHSELKAQGLWVMDLEDQGKSWLHREIPLSRSRVKSEQFSNFFRQLATMVQAGVHLIDAVSIVAGQTESKLLRNVLHQVAAEMETGTSFSKAAAAHPKIFSTIFVHMVQAGEASGTLDEMLERLAVFYEKDHFTKENVKSAMVYPLTVGIVSVLVLIFMMLVVIPSYIRQFQAMDVELPMATRIVIGISEWLQSYGYVLLPLVLAPLILRVIAARNPNMASRLDLYKLKVPIFGKLWHKQAIARFSRTFSTLLSSALPVLQAISITSKVVGNEALVQIIDEAQDKMRSGASMAETLQKSSLFPPMVTRMIAIGEQTGSLDNMLAKIADFYEADVDSITERLKTLLEPLMILVLSIVVGVIVISILLPMFSLMEGV